MGSTALHHQRQGLLKTKVLVLLRREGRVQTVNTNSLNRRVQRYTYLNGGERHIVHVVDDAKQVVGEAHESSRQQEDEMVLVQTHLRGTVRQLLAQALAMRESQTLEQTYASSTPQG